MTAHAQRLSGLAPGTLYHYRVRSTNQGGAETVSGDFTFTTASSTVCTAETKELKDRLRFNYQFEDDPFNCGFALRALGWCEAAFAEDRYFQE